MSNENRELNRKTAVKPKLNTGRDRVFLFSVHPILTLFSQLTRPWCNLWRNVFAVSNKGFTTTVILFLYGKHVVRFYRLESIRCLTYQKLFVG